MSIKPAFAVVPTDKIWGRSLSSKIPDDMNSIFMKLYVTWPTWPKGHIPKKFVIFVDFRLMKNGIFNKTEGFVGKNTSNHACQIFCSKSNCETIYHWFFLLEITMVKIMNNLNVCTPTAIYTHGPGLRTTVPLVCVLGIHFASIFMIFRFKFRTVLMVWYFLFLISLHTFTILAYRLRLHEKKKIW